MGAWALILGLTILSACTGESVTPAENPGQILEHFTMNQVKQGAARWKLSAPHAEIQLDGAADLVKPKILFFKLGTHASTVTAEKAVITGKDQDMRLEGDVLIIAHAEKTELRTQRLDYNAEAGRFRSNKEVLITRPGGRLKGSGMEGDPALSDITIYNQETVISK
jgi:LPS export ABC transporter protein LptC